MFELKRFKLLLKKYKNIFSDILGDFELEKLENDQMILKNKNGEILVASLTENFVNLRNDDDKIERRVNFKISNKDDDREDIDVLEFIKEVRPNGCIIDKIAKVYGFSRFSNEERVLVDLVSKRYVFNEDVDFGKLQDEDFLDNNGLLKTTFESHMKTFVKPYGELRYCTGSPYSTITLLNNEDISSLYDIINGKDKIIRIYDLYNGVINRRDSNDIMGINLGLVKKKCFGYKNTSGITEKENSICGKSDSLYNVDLEFINNLIRTKIGYNDEFNLDDTDSLIKTITYRKSSKEKIKEMIKNELGISYEEFDKLDLDEQEKLIQNHNMKSVNNDDKIYVMIGSGRNDSFIKVKKGTKVMSNGILIEAGLTSEEERKRVDNVINKILKKIKR